MGTACLRGTDMAGVPTMVLGLCTLPPTEGDVTGLVAKDKGGFVDA